MRILLGFCRACGHPDVEAHAKEIKDIHGHMIQYSEWSTCNGCGLTEMTIPCRSPSTAKPT